MRALALLAMLMCTIGFAPEARALTKVRLGYCAKTLSIGAAPFAVAAKMGWFAERGIEVELIPFSGSTECMQFIIRGEIDFTYSTAEALAALRTRGIKGKVFYTIHHKNLFGFAVPAESSIQSISDLKGKTIGVTSMGSTGVLIARALVGANGLDPNSDIKLAAIGEAGQSAALVRSKQVDALSQFAQQYAQIEFAGVKLRRLDNSLVADFPSNGFAGLEATLTSKRNEAIALARGFAMGNVFLYENPEAASRILYKLYPESRPTGRDESATFAIDKLLIDSTKFSQDIHSLGIAKWGLSNLDSYDKYMRFLKKWDVIKSEIAGADLATNDLIDGINDFDAEAVKEEARSYGAKRAQ